MRNSLQRFFQSGILRKNSIYVKFTTRVKPFSLSYYSKYNFAKIGKKKAEKLEKEKEKATTEIPSEIDFTSYEDSLKQEIENYKVKKKEDFLTVF